MLTCHAEIFSFAALPWDGVAEVEAMNRMRALEKLGRPDDCPEDVYTLVLLECWKLDPARRIAASSIVGRLEAYQARAGHEAVRSELTWPEMRSVEAKAEESEVAPIDVYIDLTSEEVAREFEQLEIDPRQLSMGRQLGRGQFGTVWLGTLQRDDESESVAVKMLSESGVPEAERRQFEYEAKLLSSIRHESVVRVVGVCFKQQPNMLVVELMAGGDLRSYLKSHAAELRLDVEALFGACEQVRGAMEYLESKRVVHRDLAARHAYLCCDCRLMSAQERACGRLGAVHCEAERCRAVAHTGQLRLLPQGVERLGAGEVDGAGEHPRAIVHECVGRVVVWRAVLGGVHAWGGAISWQVSRAGADGGEAERVSDGAA